jgi:hypothetical protein
MNRQNSLKMSGGASQGAAFRTGQNVNMYTYDTSNLTRGEMDRLRMLGGGDGGVHTDMLRENQWQQGAQNVAQSDMNKELFMKLGGQVDPNDPWGFYREGAGNQLANTFLKGNDPSNFYREKLQRLSSGEYGAGDPSYDWRFQQGQQAVERSLAAKGLLNSGNAALELQAYGQGLASTEYQADFQRTLQGLDGVSKQYDTQFQRLAQMAGIGLDPTGTDKIQTQQQGNAVQAQGNQLDYAAKMANINQNQSQWNDQLGMAQQYEAGIRDTLSSNGAMQMQNMASPYSAYNSKSY